MKSATSSTLYVLLSALVLAIFAGCRQGPQSGPQYYDPPVAAENAVSTLEVANGFTVELFASEPLIADPVAMEVDEYGRIYVLEMPGYPLDVSGSGRVKLLADTNGDGFPDQTTVFAEGLILPKGLMRWKNGIIVTDAPDLIYLEDTTGDGRADSRRVMLTGFARSNPQHNFNKPIYGLDNWIYLANGGLVWTETYTDIFGDRGREVMFPENPLGPVLPRNADNRNVRFRPDTYELENLSSWTQFGHDFDAWGRHFMISNAHHQFHEVIAARYLERNPGLLIRSPSHYTPDHGNAAQVYPITRNPEHQLLTDVGVMTSAAGITYYLGGAFPPEYDHVTFMAEPVHNIVHADRLEEHGATFRATRVLEDREFLASTDAWFRPVNFYVGPDGALYVIDYYRHIIEHPQWMADEAIETMDLWAGTNRGRIFRVSTQGAQNPAWVGNVHMGNTTTDELVAHLESPNIWWRRNAQRLLMDRRPEDAVSLLIRLARESQLPEARLHALWTLDGLGSLTVDLIHRALSDSEAGVRENAIQMAELYLGNDPELLAALFNLEDDPSPRVRYQLALTLGEMDAQEVVAVRERLLYRDIEDEWMQVAALSAFPRDDAEIFDQAVARLADEETPGRRAFFRRVGAMVGASGDVDRMRLLVRAATDSVQRSDTWWRASALDGLAEYTRRSEMTPAPLATERDRLVSSVIESEVPEIRRASLTMLETLGLPAGAAARSIIERCMIIASDPAVDPDFRADALQLLALSNPAEHEEALRELVNPREPAIVQRAALRNLAQVPGEEVGRFVLERWERMTPEVRTEAVDVLMTDPDRVTMLLDAVEDNKVLISTIGWGRRVTLMRDWSGEIRDRARELLSEDPAARREVIDQYQSSLAMTGNPQRGRQIFIDNCSQCHQMSGELGVAFGPDLGTVRHWAPQALLAKILDPSRAIADGYEMWLVERHDGQTVTGVIAAETPASVTLRNQGGVETTVPRSDITSITASNVSVMPAGMEQMIDEQQMADLLAFLRGLR